MHCTLFIRKTWKEFTYEGVEWFEINKTRLNNMLNRKEKVFKKCFVHIQTNIYVFSIGIANDINANDFSYGLASA